MKAKNFNEAKELEHIPNIGKSIASDLRLLGITNPKQLIGKDGIKLYHDFNKKIGKITDPCLADVFLAATHFMNGGKSLPWWNFTKKRKQLLK